ncbi:MAG: DUF6384 family protein, partial [Pseudomonadota bacterium]
MTEPETDIGKARPATPQQLDDVLLAMDVVDTLRHREEFVLREIDDEGREAELIDRLREIYKAQGISVPDRILKDGVAALEEQRFAYMPPKPTLSVRLARIYVARDKWIKPVTAAIVALIAAFASYQIGVVQPQNARAELLRVELEETLPQTLYQ